MSNFAFEHALLIGSTGLSATTDFIPNDVALGDGSQRMALLTGPNVRLIDAHLVRTSS